MCIIPGELKSRAKKSELTTESSPTQNTTPLSKPKVTEGKDDFHWSYSDEPHAIRRKQILAKHPEIKELFGHDPGMKYTCLTLIAIQFFMAFYVVPRLTSWYQYFALAYVVGGTCNQWLGLAIHELSHNLGFKKMTHNRIFGMIVNLPLTVPFSVTFKVYHMEHHRYQGEDGIDADVPTPTEGRFFRTRLRKLVFVFCQILFYAFRPMFIKPRKPGKWEAVNAVTCIGFDLFVWRYFGLPSLLYLLASLCLGAGLHPLAGHFISEHYVFVEGHETYSYYGPLNWFAFNVGYHNEHHDFPFVAGKNLPKVRAMAPEFYDDLPQCKSWVGVIYHYIMDENITAFSRVKRKTVNVENE
mmetsp:Transcript_25709/g.37923  ORF Transcript_25709/g.37923 Transcript_25709/m.37923 type:complete len:355 (-) Transcript_25709:261-1325(-)